MSAEWFESEWKTEKVREEREVPLLTLISVREVRRVRGGEMSNSDEDAVETE